MAKKTDIKTLGDGELQKMLTEKQEELRKLRFEAAGARAKDTSAASKTRKEVARILTELGSRAKVSN